MHEEAQSEASSDEQAIDVSTRSARGLLEKAVKNGWNIDQRKKDATVAALFSVLAKETKKGNTRYVASICRTIATLEGQNQADRHLQIKHQSSVEERDYELPDESATIRVAFPVRGPQSAGDDDGDSDEGEGDDA